jgi:hypothetical protein
MTGKFKKGWEDMSTAFKGMGQEIKRGLESLKAER